MTFPANHSSHTLERRSKDYFFQNTPKTWRIGEPQQDYGIDLDVEIPEDDLFKGLHLLIQLKASADPTTVGDNEHLQFPTKTYNYLRGHLNFAMIVKYVESENLAYWMWVRDLAPPANAQQQTMTIRIPRVNRLDTTNWLAVVATLRDRTNTKLGLGT